MASNLESSQKILTQKHRLVWKTLIAFTLFHLLALCACFYLVTLQVHWKTVVWSVIIALFSGLGITAGAHRLWCHRSFKAKLPLRIFLTLCNTIAFQRSVIHWSRDHRVHHKFTDTDADPYNSTRGFFFSHIGWLLVEKHPEVAEKGKIVDVSDLEADPVLRFQKKYYAILALLLFLAIPTMVPVLCWNEDFFVSLCCSCLKYVHILQCTLLVNSAAHKWGMKPYDIKISPTENLTVAFLTWGEGWHNYHHTFPWDYRGIELDMYSGNLTTIFIHLMAKIGWAYDLKSVPEDVVKKRILKTGLGSVSNNLGQN